MADPADAPSAHPASPGSALSPASELSPLPLPLAPRTHAALVEKSRETLPAGSKMTLEEFVSWLGRVDFNADPAGQEKPPEDKHQPQETRKFRRTESAAAKTARTWDAREHSETSAAAAEPPLAEGGSLENDPPRTGDGAIISELKPRGMRENRPASNFFSSLAAQCVVVGLMGSCYLLGRMTLPGRIPAAVPPNAAAEGKEPATPLGVPEPAMGVIDQALAAQNAGDSENAFRLLDQLRRDGGHINGLDFQLGWLAYQRGDYPGALLALNRSIAEEEEVGSSYDLRGLIAGGPRPGMTADFEAATQANPFDAIAFFHWGEALRRSGKPRQALIRLRQALDRAQTPATQSLFGLKIRLAEIELGEEKNFAPALAAALARPQPASEWLLTAAAQEMRGGNYSAAAAHLEEARQVSGSAVIGSALLDYFFQGYADKPEMAGVYAEIPGPPMPPMPPAPAAFVGPAGLPAVALPAPIAAPEANRGPR